MASITHVPHLFSMRHIFLEENTASLSIQKKESKKKLNSNNHTGDTKFNHYRNTNPFKYYIIQQLFNDVNVSRCHTENFSYENIFFPFKYNLLLFFTVLLFWAQI